MKKTAIIIGASSDIGSKIFEKMEKSGWNCVGTYFCNEKPGMKQLDLTKTQEIDDFFASTFEENDYVDTLVFCSGIAQKRAIIFDTTDEEIDQLFEVNIISAIKCIKRFVSRVKGHPANVVLLGSFASKIGCSCESVYTATKSAMIGLCKSLASELGNLGIRINVVAPGFIDTKMNNNLTAEEKEDISDMTPLCRLGTSEDVAEAVNFLASEKASFITGQTIFVDGGLVLE